MNQKHTSNIGKQNDSTLVELSIVVVANSNNPTILNPDFLRNNDIVGNNYEPQGDPICTPAFSQVALTNGVTITSAPDRVIFNQTGLTLNGDNIESPEIAKRYLECIKYVPYNALGINPKAFFPGLSSSNVREFLSEKGLWSRHQDTIPEVQLKTIYKYSERTIILDISAAQLTVNNESVSGVLFQGNFHRDLVSIDVDSRVDKIKNLLDSWKADLKEFYDLTRKYLEYKQ